MARDYKGLSNREMTAVLEIKEATKQGCAIAEPGDSINLEQPNSKTRRGRVGKGIANTITTSCNQAMIEPFRIRKLPPKE
jgi:DNA (cytosine-5)-methyltransferase 1